MPAVFKPKPKSATVNNTKPATSPTPKKSSAPAPALDHDAKCRAAVRAALTLTDAATFVAAVEKALTAYKHATLTPKSKPTAAVPAATSKAATSKAASKSTVFVGERDHRFTADELSTMLRPALLQITAGMGLIEEAKGKTPPVLRTMILEAQGDPVPTAAGQTFTCDVTGDEVNTLYGLKDSSGTSYRVGHRVWEAVKKQGVSLDDIISGDVEL